MCFAENYGFVRYITKKFSKFRCGCFLVPWFVSFTNQVIGGATQTEEKLRTDNIRGRGKEKANQTHFEIGVKVRRAIKEIGGTMPENLPTAESIKIVQKKLNKDENKKIDKK